MTTSTTTSGWSTVQGQRAVMLTTFRRDGRSVPTPVGFGVVGDRLFFMTDPTSGKVKRLRHTPRVEVAASTLRGDVRGPTVPGTAVRVHGADAEAGRRAITSTNRVAWFFLLRKARREHRNWAVYAVEPAVHPTEQQPSSAQDHTHPDSEEAS